MQRTLYIMCIVNGLGKNGWVGNLEVDPINLMALNFMCPSSAVQFAIGFFA